MISFLGYQCGRLNLSKLLRQPINLIPLFDFNPCLSGLSMTSVNKSNPTVAVIIPCYNAGTALVDTLNSLLSQSYPADEIIVVDDGSHNHSDALIAESFGPAIRVVRQANTGAAMARYAGVTFAKSDIIVFNDAGDISLPHRIQSLRQALIKYPNCVAACGVTWIKSRDRPTRSKITGAPLDGSIHVLNDPLQLLFERSWPIAIGMNLAIWRDIALRSTLTSPFYKAANDYAVQINTAQYGAFAHLADISLECLFLSNGITDRYGWMQQTGYALYAATECYVSNPEYQKNYEESFKHKVEDGWPGIVLHLYLRKNFPLMKRIACIGLRYGRLSRAPMRFWWALDEAFENGLLDKNIILKGFTKVIRSFKNRLKPR